MVRWVWESLSFVPLATCGVDSEGKKCLDIFLIPADSQHYYHSPLTFPPRAQSDEV